MFGGCGGSQTFPAVASNTVNKSRREEEEGEEERRETGQGGSYLRLHGPMHGGGLGGAAVGEGFRGAGWQGGLLGGRGGLRGALYVLTVPLVGLR